MIVLAIDPGPEQSGWVLWDGYRILQKGLDANDTLRTNIHGYEYFAHADLFIEMIGHYGKGMPVGKDVFNTCIWIGRFIEAGPQLYELILRPTIKAHHCGSAKATDANVRQAILDRFGGKKAAFGTSKAPGLLYGLISHTMQAFALATYVTDTYNDAGTCCATREMVSL